MSTTLIQELLSGEQVVYERAWGAFFFNYEAVMELLKNNSTEVLRNVLAAGERWNGSSWDTTKAAKAIRELTELVLVTGNFQEYLKVFLYSLALSGGVDVPNIELSERAGDASFHLGDLWTSGLQQGGEEQGARGLHGAIGAGMQVDQDDDEEDEEEERLPWEEELKNLPADLRVCLEKVSGGYRFPIRSTLHDLPCYNGLKRQAEVNNHLRDGQGQGDRWLRGVQQRVLHLLRFMAAAHDLRAAGAGSEEQKLLALKTFTFLAELEQVVLRERKRRSLPGSVLQQENTLFSKEDLSGMREQRAIDTAGTPQSHQEQPHTRQERPHAPGRQEVRFEAFTARQREAGATQCFPLDTGRQLARYKGAGQWRGGKGYFKGSGYKGGRGGYGSPAGRPWRPGKGYETSKGHGVPSILLAGPRVARHDEPRNLPGEPAESASRSLEGHTWSGTKPISTSGSRLARDDLSGEPTGSRSRSLGRTASPLGSYSTSRSRSLDATVVTTSRLVGSAAASTLLSLGITATHGSSKFQSPCSSVISQFSTPKSLHVSKGFPVGECSLGGRHHQKTGLGGGKIFRSSSFPKAASKSALVARACWKKICENHKGGCYCRSPITPKSVQKVSEKVPRRNHIGPANLERLPKVRSHPGSKKLQQHRPFGALVCSKQTRRVQHKAPTDFRLPRTKSILFPSKVHFGKHGHNFSNPKTKLVGSEIGPKGCLFSPKVASQPAKVCKIAGRRRNVGVSRGLFWPKYIAKNFHVHRAPLTKNLEIKGAHCIRPFIRYYFVWK